MPVYYCHRTVICLSREPITVVGSDPEVQNHIPITFILPVAAAVPQYIYMGQSARGQRHLPVQGITAHFLLHIREPCDWFSSLLGPARSPRRLHGKVGGWTSAQVDLTGSANVYLSKPGTRLLPPKKVANVVVEGGRMQTSGNSLLGEVPL